MDDEGKQRTQIEMINHILDLIKYYHGLLEEFGIDDYGESEEIRGKILENFKIILPSLWN